MARRKITADTEAPQDELDDITDQQREFVRGLLDGKSASDAYRAAYNAQNMAPSTIWVEASRLRQNPKVAHWLSLARQAHFASAQITLDQHIQRLDELRQLCIASGNLGAAVQAEQLIGKARGHYIERIADVTDDDPMKTLREIAEASPDIAKILAAKFNIDPESVH